MGAIYSYFFGKHCAECGELVRFKNETELCLACLFEVQPGAEIITPKNITPTTYVDG